MQEEELLVASPVSIRASAASVSAASSVGRKQPFQASSNGDITKQQQRSKSTARKEGVRVVPMVSYAILFAFGLLFYHRASMFFYPN
jgi:hypothetical protein